MPRRWIPIGARSGVHAPQFIEKSPITSVAAIVVLLAGIAFTSWHWETTKDQLANARAEVSHAKTEVSEVQKAETRNLHALQTAMNAKLQIANSNANWDESQLKIETQIAQAETALANQPVDVIVAPTTTTTQPPSTPYSECWSSGNWVIDFCQGLYGAPS